MSEELSQPAPSQSGRAQADPDETPKIESSAEANPTFVFFGILTAISLLLDIITKAWAEVTLTVRPSIVLFSEHLAFVLTYNKGGAWGFLQDQSEWLRIPFFLVASAAAFIFIVSLYGRLVPGQRALKWGLPLVLGGALGNLSDRITRASVIDFIDYRADWVLAMNRGIAKLVRDWHPTNHWPTFNVADIFICVGVILMGVDMFTFRRSPAPSQPEGAAAGSAGEPPQA